jgi:hypothetical protein
MPKGCKKFGFRPLWGAIQTMADFFNEIGHFSFACELTPSIHTTIFLTLLRTYLFRVYFGLSSANLLTCQECD